MVILPIIFLLLSRHFRAFWSVPSASFFPSPASFLPITVLITSSPCSSFGLHQFTITPSSSSFLLRETNTILSSSHSSSFDREHHQHFLSLRLRHKYHFLHCISLVKRASASSSSPASVLPLQLLLPRVSYSFFFLSFFSRDHCIICSVLLVHCYVDAVLLLLSPLQLRLLLILTAVIFSFLDQNQTSQLLPSSRRELQLSGRLFNRFCFVEVILCS